MIKTLITYALFGLFGIVLEVLFTGVKNIIKGNWKGAGETYVWMIPVYMIAAGCMSIVHVLCGDSVPFLIRGILYLIVIYDIELLSGTLLQVLIGVVPWDYGDSRWTPFGVINLKYAPLWYLVALIYEPLARFYEVLVNKF